MLKLLCCFSKDLGISLANFLANLESMNFFLKPAFRLLGHKIGFSGAALPKSLPLSVARPNLTLSRANNSFEITVLPLNKAFSRSLIKRVLTTIFLIGIYIKKVFKFSIAKRRLAFILRASLRDLDLFLGGIKTS